MTERIKNHIDLKTFFIAACAPRQDYSATALVSTRVRRDWMLSGERIILRGHARNLKFKNLGGGVWRASMRSPTYAEELAERADNSARGDDE